VENGVRGEGGVLECKEAKTVLQKKENEPSYNLGRKKSNQNMKHKYAVNRRK